MSCLKLKTDEVKSVLKSLSFNAIFGTNSKDKILKIRVNRVYKSFPF